MQKSHLQVTRTYFLEISISILDKYELSIYLSPLEIGDKNFKFLFLLSILLFRLSSMPVDVQEERTQSKPYLSTHTMTILSFKQLCWVGFGCYFSQSLALSNIHYLGWVGLGEL